MFKLHVKNTADDMEIILGIAIMLGQDNYDMTFFYRAMPTHRYKTG